MFFSHDDALQQLGDRLLETVWAAFPGLARNQIALTWLVYEPPAPINTGGALTAEAFWQYSPRGYSYRGVERIDPAGIVKLFYLVAVHEWLERGMAQPSTELDRAVRDMIVDSSNDATSLVVDVLTGTTSGPELSPGPFETWKTQRNLINRYFESFGWAELQTINVNQKIWGEGAYGRERIFLGELMDNRNMLTTIATARLLHSIIGGVAVSANRSQLMMNLLRRSLNAEVILSHSNNQVTGFLGAGLPLDAALWSIGAETDRVRHDAAYIELPDCYPYLLVVFTDSKESSKNESILPFISRQLVELMRSLSRREALGQELS
ncbi:MAG: serine hydrolase [Pantanalinema sp. GBBB05]|nr:serine hydrolase [Pantanalinema sp. GBBB05]